MAAMLHDIGKIGVPTEILTKPGQLSCFEMGILKTHPESGRNIIGDVDFSWPVADAVWQHHERMDGTGYPRGLSGSAICLEARIIAVADTVDAIASHRPYREARGLAAARLEIKRCRGTSLDADAVDACLAVLSGGELDWQPAPHPAFRMAS